MPTCRRRIDGLATLDTGATSNVLQVNGSLTIVHASMSGNPGQYGIAAGETIRIGDAVVTGHGVDLAARACEP